MVFFGTGKFFETGDNIVGAHAAGADLLRHLGQGDEPRAITYPPTDRTTSLTQQDILYEGQPTGSNFDVRVTTQNTRPTGTRSAVGTSI